MVRRVMNGVGCNQFKEVTVELLHNNNGTKVATYREVLRANEALNSEAVVSAHATE